MQEHITESERDLHLAFEQSDPGWALVYAQTATAHAILGGGASGDLIRALDDQARQARAREIDALKRLERAEELALSVRERAVSAALSTIETGDHASVQDAIAARIADLPLHP